jgi:hypothetical protein
LFQPRELDFLLDRLEVRVAGDQLGVPEPGQGGGKTIGVRHLAGGLEDGGLTDQRQIFAHSDHLDGKGGDLVR